MPHPTKNLLNLFQLKILFILFWNTWALYWPILNSISVIWFSVKCKLFNRFRQIIQIGQSFSENLLWNFKHCVCKSRSGSWICMSFKSNFCIPFKFGNFWMVYSLIDVSNFDPNEVHKSISNWCVITPLNIGLQFLASGLSKTVRFSWKASVKHIPPRETIPPTKFNVLAFKSYCTWKVILLHTKTTEFSTFCVKSTGLHLFSDQSYS